MGIFKKNDTPPDTHADDDPLFLATYAGQIEGVFLRIESADPHPKVSLFVKLP